MIDVNIFLFDDFETLDVFGPVEVIGRLMEQYQIRLFSLNGGQIVSRQKITVVTEGATAIKPGGILLIPGGLGTRGLVHQKKVIDLLKTLADEAAYCLTVCTGTALLAQTGLLNGVRATTNKKAYDWVTSLNDKVKWVYEARWVADSRYYTSSGVSAGIDMTLGFVADRHGKATSKEIAQDIEYIWNENADFDPFCIKEGSQ